MGTQTGFVQVSAQLLPPPPFVKVVMARAKVVLGPGPTMEPKIDVAVVVLMPVALRLAMVDGYTREVKEDDPKSIDLPRSFAYARSAWQFDSWQFESTITDYEYLVHDHEELMEIVEVAKLPQHDELYNRVTRTRIIGGLWPDDSHVEMGTIMLELKKEAEEALLEKMAARKQE